MEQETPTSKDLALLVLSCEQGDDPDLSELQAAVRRTFEKLNVHLSVRLGSGGYQALLRRALTRAARDVPWLASVFVSDDGLIDGFQNMSEYQPVADGCVAILARLIELLDTFIGRVLTVRVLQCEWPNIIVTDEIGRQGERIGKSH